MYISILICKDCNSCFEQEPSASTGDFCEDTSPDAFYVVGDYNAETKTCSMPDMKQGVPSPCEEGKLLHQLPFTNIMSMRAPGCKNEFSKCQHQRMRCWAHFSWKK